MAVSSVHWKVVLKAEKKVASKAGSMVVQTVASTAIY